MIDSGITVKTEKRRPDKFAAFVKHASNKAEQAPTYQPRSYQDLDRKYKTYESERKPKDENPYANMDMNYSAPTNVNEGSNPYDSETLNGGDGMDGDLTQSAPQLQRYQTNFTQDLNAPPDMASMYQSQSVLEEDLNEFPSQQEYEDQLLSQEEREQIAAQQQEDEDVEEIKQDIRFTKQQSVASTRNTLRMAQEAEMSGENTLGMLGSQSDRLYNTERNLALAETQNKIADDKVKELKKLQRSIFAVHASNPFNSKRRLHEKEEKIKQKRREEKIIQDRQRSEVQASEKRISNQLRERIEPESTKATNSALYGKYSKEKALSEAERYQFENDSEDDDMELEIHNNLNQIGDAASRLKRLAVTAGQELNTQSKRLGNIEEDTDKLDINVHLNNSRMANIR